MYKKKVLFFANLLHYRQNLSDNHDHSIFVAAPLVVHAWPCDKTRWRINDTVGKGNHPGQALGTAPTTFCHVPPDVQHTLRQISCVVAALFFDQI